MYLERKLCCFLGSCAVLAIHYLFIRSKSSHVHYSYIKNCYCELVTNVVYDNLQTPKAQMFSK